MFRRKTMAEIEVTSQARGTAPRPQVVVALDDVRSMANVGAIFRTCDAFGAAELWLCGITPAPPHRDIHKTALGATETVAWRHFITIADALQAAREAGLRVVAVEQAAGSISLDEVAELFNRPALLVFGNEVAGVSDAVLEAADACVEIPQVGAKHSLNISVSVGVVLWEVVRAGAATSRP